MCFCSFGLFELKLISFEHILSENKLKKSSFDLILSKNGTKMDRICGIFEKKRVVSTA